MAPTSAHAVYGGHNASNATYPWAVYVQSGSSQWCSGSLVATQWVLTAAHCVTTWPGQEGNSGCDFFLQIAFHNDTCRLFTTKPRVELPNWTKEPASNYTVWVGSATRASGTSIGVDRIAVAPYFQPILHVAAPARGCPIIPSRCEGAVSVEGSSGDVALLHLKAAVTAPRVRLANSLPGSSTSLRFVGFGDTDPTAAFSAPRVLQETPN